MRKKMKPEALAFIKFFNTQGVKFVDHETGEEIKVEEYEDGCGENEETNK